MQTPNEPEPQRGRTPSPIVDFAVEIRRVWAEGGANTLEMARAVSAARKQLAARGEWSEFWCSSEMPFSKRKADMLLRVARLAGLNEKMFSHFPRGWSILHQLARIELDELERLTREGVIHPDLTFAEASKLARRRRGRKGQPKRPAVK